MSSLDPEADDNDSIATFDYTDEEEDDDVEDDENEQTKPVPDEDLPEDIRIRFFDLLDEAYDLLTVNTTEEAVNAAGHALNVRIREQVSEFPILAKAVSKGTQRWSLLLTVCEKTYHWGVCHEAIKFLISANPHALLWGGEENSALICISQNCCHCSLLPWIAENFPWVFDHKICRRSSPHMNLVRLYANGECDASIVRSFYEAYPRGLKQKQFIQGTPLHCCLTGREECDAELFEFIANGYPKAMMRPLYSLTLLHFACQMLIKYNSENMFRICNFLVRSCPSSVRIQGSRGEGFAIHKLTEKFHRPLVQKLAIVMLKEYPGCIDVDIEIPADEDDDSEDDQMVNDRMDRPAPPKLSEFTFIQKIIPLLQQESDIEEERQWLGRAVDNLKAANQECNNILKFEDVFSAWARSRLMNQGGKQKQVIKNVISQVRLAHQNEESEDESIGEDWL